MMGGEAVDAMAGGVGSADDEDGAWLRVGEAIGGVTCG